MKIKQVTEVVWRTYNEGKANVTKQTFQKADIYQAVLMAFGSLMLQRFYATKKKAAGDEYYFFSGDLDTKEYELSEPKFKGLRRVLIPDEVVRLPQNADIVNVYPVGEGCGENEIGEITQVMPGEENFYIDDDDFKFFVQKGKGINTYHIPPCVKKISVERIYVTDDMDISLDMAFDIAQQVWKITLGIKGEWEKDQILLRKLLKEQEGVK